MTEPTKYVYFSDKELEGLVPDICFKLDRARQLFGSAITITSGYRNPDHNAKVGGVKASEHTQGMGVDIKAPADPFMRIKLAWALGAAGFRRVGVYTKHFHAGTSSELPTPAIWDGGDSH